MKSGDKVVTVGIDPLDTMHFEGVVRKVEGRYAQVVFAFSGKAPQKYAVEDLKVVK